MSTAIAREAKKKQREPDDRLLREVRESVTIPGEHRSNSNTTSSNLGPPSGPRRSHSDQHSSSKPLPPRMVSSNSSSGNGSSNLNPFADSSSASRPKESESSRARRKAREAEDKKKKASKHADVIDKLDPSGFWGTGMLHHESAYDAAAPSRNKSSHAAPMRAFDPNAADSSSSQQPHQGSSFSAGAEGRPSPLKGDSYKESSVTFDDADKIATPTNDYVDSVDYVSGPGLSKSKSLKKTRSRSGDRSSKEKNTPMPAEEDYINARAKDQKNALANAWGVADPEPFEDFGMTAASSAPRGETGLASAASSIWNGYDGHGGRSRSTSGTAAPIELGKPVAGGEMTEEMLDEPIAWNRPAVSRKESSGGTGVKRTKSLMQRIRNMRENPNVPLPTDDTVTTPNGTTYPSSSQAFPSPTGGQQPRSRSPLPPPPAPSSSSSYNDDSAATRNGMMGHRTTSSQSAANTNKRLPPPPPPLPSTANSGSAFDPFADDVAHQPSVSTPRAPSAQHQHPASGSGSGSHSGTYPTSLSAPTNPHSSGRARGARSPRSPVPPPAPLDLPGSGGYFPRVGGGEDTFEELGDYHHHNGSSSAGRKASGAGGSSGGAGGGGGGSGGAGGAGLGRKPSLMKRLMGKAGGSSS